MDDKREGGGEYKFESGKAKTMNNTLDSGKKIKLTGMEFIFGPTAIDMKESGWLV